MLFSYHYIPLFGPLPMTMNGISFLLSISSFKKSLSDSIF
jgi:hypothetical protein